MERFCAFVDECDYYTLQCEAMDCEECELFYAREESDEFNSEELC